MRIGGYQKTSLIDYPGKVAAVIFTQGCNFRCPFCHNRDLVLVDFQTPLFDTDAVLDDLKERRKLLDGVVITGGEPTIQPNLEEFIKKIKSLGLSTKLDTNGSTSTILGSMVNIKLVDYVALDLKAPLDERYKRVSKYRSIKVSKVEESISFLVRSGIEYELRTTVVPGLHSEKDILDLGRQLSEIAPKAKWVLQNFQPKNCLDPAFLDVEPYDQVTLEKFLAAARGFVPNAQLRGLL